MENEIGKLISMISKLIGLNTVCLSQCLKINLRLEDLWKIKTIVIIKNILYFLLCSKCLCIRQIKKMRNLQKDVVLHFKAFRSRLKIVFDYSLMVYKTVESGLL